MRVRALFLAASPLLVFVLTGCATTITYVPSDDNAKMTLIHARRILAENEFKVVGNKTLVLNRVDVKRNWTTITVPLKDLKVASGQPAALTGAAGVAGALEFPGLGHGRVILSQGKYSAREVAEAIYIVQRQAEREGFQPRDEEGEFDKVAVAYLAVDVKPELDAEARRFKVQAEDALREKRFEDVADLYGEALTIAPWWPAGHYNRALVLSELKEYPDAVAEMRRYLRLAPNADNAVAAQDEIYKWEAKVGQVRRGKRK